MKDKLSIPAAVVSGFLAILLAAPFPASARTAPQETWTPEKSMRIRTVDNLALSPDSQWIIYSVTGLVEGDEWTSRTQLWLARSDGSETRQLTDGEYSCASPAWSPDGRRIAFLSSRGGGNNIWLMDPFGTGEPWRITDLTMGATSFKWSPDGTAIAFLMADPPSQETLAIMAKKIPRVVGRDKAFLNIHVVPVPRGRETPEVRRLTHGDFVVTGLTWSPDGRTITFSHQPSADQDFVFDNEISRVGVDGGEVVPLVRQPGWDLQPAYSPDGKWILFSSAGGDPDRTISRYHNDFALIPAGGGSIRYLTPSWSQSSGFIKWKGDGTGLYYGEAHGTYSEVFFEPVDGSPPVPYLAPGRGVIGAIDISDDGKLVVFAQEFMDKPVEIYAKAGDAPARQVTRLNEFAAGIRYAPTELISWKSDDGIVIEGLLTYPLNFEKGRRYPLLLSAHAGLYHHSQNNTARFTGYPLQALAADGFMILRPNPRGSNDRTLEFREAIARDWSGVTYEDNISGVDYLIKAGLADPERLGVFGWSTGGFMTAWIIARTSRFGAASIGAAPVDLVSFTNTSDSVEWLPAFFKTYVWQDDRPYREQSSLFHMKEIKTPTLILWGENDVRVPISQGWELYNTLKQQGTEVEFVIYPRSGHVPTDPRFMLDLARRNVDWFNKHLSRKTTGASS